MRMNWVSVLLGLILVGPAVVAPAVAGTPFYYTLSVGPYTPSGSSSLSGWTATWQSNALIIPPTDGTVVQILDEPDFSVAGTPAGYSMITLNLYEVAFAGLWGFTAVFNPPGTGVLYEFSFSNAIPPSTTGNFYSYSTKMSLACCGALDAGPQATLTIVRAAPPPPPPPPFPAWALATIRASLVLAGPITPPPGGPVEATVGFVDVNGSQVGPLTPVSLVQGQVASVTLNASTFLQSPGQHAILFPVITAPPGTLLPPLQFTTEVFDSQTGYGAVLATTSPIVPPPSSLAPQGLAGGQIMRLIATAFQPSACVAVLSFADSNGHLIGSTLDVNLAPGNSKTLDLYASSLTLPNGQRVEVQPMITLLPVATASATAAASSSACAATSEVFDQATGRTWTYQYAEIR